MTPVDKYIRKLLFEFDCVIIPDFGGLLTHHVGVQYDESTKIFKPAGKRVAFNEILKIDDGLLAYYLAAGEKISRDQATDITRQYVASLRADLENQRLTTIDRIGNFSTNSEGKLIFEPDYSQNYDQNWYGLNEVKAERSEWQPNWLRQENVAVQETEALVDHDDATILVADKNNLRWGWAAAAVLLCAVSAASYLYEPTDNSLLSSLNPISLVGGLYHPSDEMVSITYEESTSLPQSNVAYFQEFKPESIQLLGETANEFEEDPTMIEVVSSVDEQPIIAQEAEYYHLVAGSFVSQKNARKLKSQLIRQGFKGASVLADTPGKWIKVSAGSYETHSAADKDRAKVDRLMHAESWVYHR